VTDPVDNVRQRLRELGRRVERDRGDSFQAQCPAHDDHKPSLHVATGDDGRAVLYCHAGCEHWQVRDALGFAGHELYPEPLPSRARERAGQGRKEARKQGSKADVMEAGSGTARSVGSNESEVEALLQLEARGEAEPLAGERLVLPDDASEPMRRVAAFFERVRGLRRWADMPEADEVPFAYRWVARHVGLPERTTGQALNRLRRAGVLEVVGELERRGGLPRGTLVVRAVPLRPQEPEPALPASAGRVEADDAGRVEERQEVGEDAAVRRAVAVDRGEVLEGDGVLGAAVADAGVRAGESSHASRYNGSSGGARCAIFDCD
jgi:DNA-binding transcriptional ArsR family regulator